MPRDQTRGHRHRGRMVWPAISTCPGSLRREYQIGPFVDCYCSFDRGLHPGWDLRAAPAAGHWVGTWAPHPLSRRTRRADSRARGDGAPETSAPCAPRGSRRHRSGSGYAVRSYGQPGRQLRHDDIAGAGAPMQRRRPRVHLRAFAFPRRPLYGSSDMTLREIVHVSLGGPRIRVVFTNEFGTEALRIGSAQAALSKGGNAIDATPASSARLTFGGREYAIIPAGGLMVSDPVRAEAAGAGRPGGDLLRPAADDYDAFAAPGSGPDELCGRRERS